jgi:hypothetical protein
LDVLLERALNADEPDTQAIERLSRARSSLEENERRASSRSLPPVLRVQDQAPRKRGLLNDLPE